MQEKKLLRDALTDLFDAVRDWHWGEPSDRAEFGDGDTWERSADAIRASMEQAMRVLASTTDETEMEKLRQIILQERALLALSSLANLGEIRGFDRVLYHIAIFGYGEEEGDADSS